MIILIPVREKICASLDLLLQVRGKGKGVKMMKKSSKKHFLVRIPWRNLFCGVAFDASKRSILMSI